ncbi:hypothetical protein AX16_006075 [Volvariella volvacea WC 439]|nr:hypothetical protein AX16_006075 [Volvariella volvacea WC 439]
MSSALSSSLRTGLSRLRPSYLPAAASKSLHRTLLTTSTTGGVSSTNKSASPSSVNPQVSALHTAFPFLPKNALPTKPRGVGLTEIRGPYYFPVTRTYLDELLNDWGEYVDGVKFAGGSFSLMKKENLKELIDIAHKHDCYVSTGGYIERVLATSAGNPSVVNKYLQACKDIGFDVLEISSGFLSIPTQDWASLIELTTSYGLKAKPEIGIQWGAGGDASVEELEQAGTRSSNWLIERADTFLDAGASMIMIESEGITENVRNWRTDVISAITSNLPTDRVMFEAADPKVFSYYVQNIGADANLFIDHSQIVQLACLRRGIWGTGTTFGRIVTFNDSQSDLEPESGEVLDTNTDADDHGSGTRVV